MDDQKILPGDIVIVDYMFHNNSKKGWMYQTDTDRGNSSKKAACLMCNAKIPVSKCFVSECRVRNYCSEDCFKRDLNHFETCEVCKGGKIYQALSVEKEDNKVPPRGKSLVQEKIKGFCNFNMAPHPKNKGIGKGDGAKKNVHQMPSREGQMKVFQ